MNHRARGDVAEEAAARFLRKRGYRVLERNYQIRGGELDIIAEKEGVLRFIEVKSGVGFDPVYNITPAKIRTLISTAQRYMKQKGLDMSYCFDAVLVRGEEVELIENITL